MGCNGTMCTKYIIVNFQSTLHASSITEMIESGIRLIHYTRKCNHLSIDKTKLRYHSFKNYNNYLPIHIFFSRFSLFLRKLFALVRHSRSTQTNNVNDLDCIGGPRNNKIEICMLHTNNKQQHVFTLLIQQRVAIVYSGSMRATRYNCTKIHKPIALVEKQPKIQF